MKNLTLTQLRTEGVSPYYYFFYCKLDEWLPIPDALFSESGIPICPLCGLRLRTHAKPRGNKG